METVPVGEMEMTLPFSGVIVVAAVQTPLQMVKSGDTATPAESVVMCPFRLNLIVIGKVPLVGMILVSLRPENSTVRTSSLEIIPS